MHELIVWICVQNSVSEAKDLNSNVSLPQRVHNEVTLLLFIYLYIYTSPYEASHTSVLDRLVYLGSYHGKE